MFLFSRVVFFLIISCFWAKVSTASILTLRQAIDTALEHNLDYRQLTTNAELAGIALEDVRAVFNTKFSSSFTSDARSGAEIGSNFDLGLRKQNESGSQLSGGVYSSAFGERYLSEMRVRYTLPLFDFAEEENRLKIQNAQEAYEQNKFLTQIGKEELISSVIKHYFRLAQNTLKLDLVAKKFRIGQLKYEWMQLKNEKGLLSELEMRNATIAFEKLQDQRSDALFDLLQQESEFKMMLGLDPDAELSLDLDTSPVFSHRLLDISAYELEQSALTNRKEITATLDEIDRLKNRRQLDTSKKYPVEVSIQYALVGEADNFKDSFQLDDKRLGVGLRILTDFDADTRLRDKQAKDLRYGMKLKDLERLKNKIKLEIRRSYHGVSQAERRMKYAQNDLTQTQMKFEESEIFFKEGKLTYLELLERDYDLDSARFSYSTSRFDYYIAMEALAKVSGNYEQLWSYE